MLDTGHELSDLTSWLSVLERIVETSANMVVITDANQRIRWVNTTYTIVTGWTLEEVMGKRPAQLLHGPNTDPALSRQVGERLKQGLSISSVEMTNYRKCGEPYTVSLNIEPIRDSNGEVIAFFSIQNDVSERRALERANSRLQRELQVAQELAKIGRIHIDSKSGKAKLSGEAHALFELSKQDPNELCSTLLELIQPKDKESLLQKVQLMMRSGSELDEEVEIITPKGRRRWIRCRARPEQLGNTLQAPETWTVQDVSAYRELLEQKRLTNEKLRSLVDERTHHLEEAYRSLEAFSHALSHDLKKPVRHMVSYSQIVEEALENQDIESAKAYCRKIVQAGNLLQSQIKALLDFSRLGKRGLSPSWVSMPDLVSTCLAQVSASFQSHAFTASGIEALPSVWADPALLREVWMNLLDNAFKYSKASHETVLDLSSVETDQGWTVSIQDNGSGFDQALHEQIFQMFGRASHRNDVAGDGIGLALCQRIVHAHGGRIWAESSPNQGAVFRVFLPKSRQPETSTPANK